jgi:uncharacterized protein
MDEFNFSSEYAYFLAEGDVDDPAVLLAIGEVEERARASTYYNPSDPTESPIQLGLTMSAITSPKYNPVVATAWATHIDKDGDLLVDSDGSITQANVTAYYTALMTADADSTRRVLHNNTSGEFDGLVIRIPVNSQGMSRSDELTADMESAGAPLKALKGDQLDTVWVVGGPIVSNAILQSINDSQMRSLGITLVLSLIILTALYMWIRRSLLLGLITILPLTFVITWGTGLMYLMDIPLNVMTVTIGSLTVGLGITYCIHVTQRFLDDLDELGEPHEALRKAVTHTGSALFGAAATTMAGFGVITFSIMPPLAQFGMITAMAIGFSFLASILVLPTFLLLWCRGRTWYMIKRGKDPSSSKNGDAQDPKGAAVSTDGNRIGDAGDARPCVDSGE